MFQEGEHVMSTATCSLRRTERMLCQLGKGREMNDASSFQYFDLQTVGE